MNRASWNAQRRRVRDSYPSRADRGLPAHPDGSGFCVCRECNGTGSIDVAHNNPECEASYTCSACGGDGSIVDGHRDPLLRLRYARQRRVRTANPSGYRYLRQLCAVPVWQLRLIEAAVGCELAAKNAVTAWRQVA